MSATFLIVCLKAQTMESKTSLNCWGGIVNKAEKQIKKQFDVVTSTRLNYKQQDSCVLALFCQDLKQNFLEWLLSYGFK